MYIAFLVFVRITSALALAMVLGFLGLVVIFLLDFLWKSSPDWVFRVLWFSAGGLAAGLGSHLAWMHRDSSRWLSTLAPFLVLLAGLAGAWGGYAYKAVILHDLTRYNGPEVSSIALFGAAVASTLVATAIGWVRQARSGWW